MARKILFKNSKGGVLKTTSSVNIAVEMAKRGLKTLLIDTDTQNQAKVLLGVEPQKQLFDIIMGSPAKDVIHPVRENLDIIGSGHNTDKINTLIMLESVGKEKFISRKLAELDDVYDVILIDCAPAYGDLTTNLLHYCNDVVIPVSLLPLSVEGLASFTSEIEILEQLSNITIPYKILPTVYDKRLPTSKNLYRELFDFFGDKLLSPIHVSIDMAKCAEKKQPVHDFLKATNRAIVDIEYITTEILEGV